MENRDTGIQIFKGILSRPAKETTQQIADLVTNGEANPAYVGVVLKKFAKIFEDFKEKHKDAYNTVVEDTLKYKEGNKKSFKVFGATVTDSGKSYWDYSQTEDPLLEKLKEIETTIKEQIKGREAELQAKAEAWEKLNTPKDGGINFKISPFVIHVDSLPELIWEEAIADISTNPPLKKINSYLAYRV